MASAQLVPCCSQAAHAVTFCIHGKLSVSSAHGEGWESSQAKGSLSTVSHVHSSSPQILMGQMEKVIGL